MIYLQTIKEGKEKKMKKVVLLFLMIFSAAVLFAEASESETKTELAITPVLDLNFELPLPVFGIEKTGFFSSEWFDYKTQQTVDRSYINECLKTVPKAESYLEKSKTFSVISAVLYGSGVVGMISSFFIQSKKAKAITSSIGYAGIYLGGAFSLPANRCYSKAVDEYNRKVLGLYRK